VTTETAPEFVYGLSPVNDADALTKAIHRLATAVEQQTLALLDQRLPAPVQITTPPLATLPPVQGQAAPVVSVEGCPVHRQPWKLVPAGISKSTGNPYDAFRACPVRGCTQRPPR
jgi:hypothetical protein